MAGSQEICCPIHPEITNWKKPLFHCGRKAWQVLSVLRLRRLLCLFRLAPSCRLRRLARWREMAQMVSTATQPRYATAMFHSNQPETFPLSAGVSRPYLPSAPNKATETVIFCFGKMFARAAASAGGSSSNRRKQQQQEAAEAAAAAAAGSRKQPGGSSSSSRRKQQQQQQQQQEEATAAAAAAAAAAGGSSSSSRRKQQQQQEEAATAGGGSSSMEQQAACKQQMSSNRQAAASSSKQQAAGKQQPAFAPLKE